MIQPIVEGHGEVSAVPVLLRKLAELMRVPALAVGRPIRAPRSKLTQQEGMTKYVQMARSQEGCRGILVMFDADDLCPKTESEQVRQWAAVAATPIPCSLVLPNREYEGWFLACIEVLMQYRAIQPVQQFAGNPDDKRGAKEAVEDLMGEGFRYIERADQPSFTAQADWLLVHERSRSFRKMAKEVQRLLGLCGYAPIQWP